MFKHLQQYAQTLAAEHKIVLKKGRARLLPRLEDNGRKLVATYRILVDALRGGRSISPAAEWLVDNFHLVEEQLREIRQDLPKSYYQELPKLAEGELKDNPRIYAVAVALIAHTDCRLDTNTLRRFINAYQTGNAADDWRALGHSHYAAVGVARRKLPGLCGPDCDRA